MSLQSQPGAGVPEDSEELVVFSLHQNPEKLSSNTNKGMSQPQDGLTCQLEWEGKKNQASSHIRRQGPDLGWDLPTSVDPAKKIPHMCAQMLGFLVDCRHAQSRAAITGLKDSIPALTPGCCFRGEAWMLNTVWERYWLLKHFCVC